MISESFIRKHANVSESYFFYKGEVELRYDIKNHQYFLLKDGDLELQAGVTTIVGIIDKSQVLMNWACKVMAQKLYKDVLTIVLPNGDHIVPQMSFADFERLVIGAKGAHKEHLEDAGNVGTIAHDWLENHIKRDIARQTATEIIYDAVPLPSEERAASACIAAMTWMSDHKVKWICTERKIYSRRYKYAGTLDGLALVSSCSNPKCCPTQFENRMTVVDWKTSRSLHKEYCLQTAAYLYAFNEEIGYEDGLDTLFARDRWVIRLDKESGEFDPWHLGVETQAEDFQAYLDCLDLNKSVEIVESRIKARAEGIRAEVKAEKVEAKKLKDESIAILKAETKAKKKQERVEALRLDCGKKYTGQRKPKCGCDKHKLLYEQVQAAKPVKTANKSKTKPKDKVKIDLFDILPEWSSPIDKSTPKVYNVPEVAKVLEVLEVSEAPAVVIPANPTAGE